MFIRSQNVRMEGLQLDDVVYISEQIDSEMRRTQLQDNDVLLNITGASIGRVSVFEGSGIRANVNQHVCVVRTKAEVLAPRYLARYIGTPAFQARINQIQNGGTRQALTFSQIADFPIPLPSLEEQKRIAAILEKADAIRRKRAKSIDLAAEFLRSLFLDMFGDPLANPKSWPLVPLKATAVEFSDGPFGSNLKTEHYTDEGVRVVRLQNIGIGKFVNDDRVFVSQQHAATISKHFCYPGDILIGTLGDPNLRACILPEEIGIAINKADCVRLSPNKQIADTHYLCWLLNSPRILAKCASSIHGQTRSRISFGQLRVLEVPLPPISLQRRFAVEANKALDLQLKARQSSEVIDCMYQSLAARAFRGEL